MNIRLARLLAPLAMCIAAISLESTPSAQSLFITRDAPANQVQVSSIPSSGLLFQLISELDSPNSIRLGRDGMLYVVMQGSTNTVKRYYPPPHSSLSLPYPPANSTQDMTFALTSPPPDTSAQFFGGSPISPVDVAFDPTSDIMYISDVTSWGAGRILRYRLNSQTWLPSVLLSFPAGWLLSTGSALLYGEAAPANHVGRLFHGSTTPSVVIPTGSGGLAQPQQIALVGSKYYVASSGTNQLLKYNLDFTFAAAVPSGAELVSPIGVAGGPDGEIYVTSTGSGGQVLEYAAAGGSFIGAFSAASDARGLLPYEEPRARFPVAAGELVTTCCPELAAGGVPNPLGECVKIVDVRVGGPTGENWPAPMFSNEFPVGPNTWNHQNLGCVFGTTLDDATAPNIYVAASTTYGNFGGNTFGPAGAGGVYQLGGCNGKITQWMVTGTGAIGTNTLPNTGPGLGDICYDALHKQFFVSNFEDGKIYRVKNVGGAGIVQQVFDPFATDDGSAGFAPLGERVWAVHVIPPGKVLGNAGILLFSVWLRDRDDPLDPDPERQTTPLPASWPPLGTTDTNNAIFALAINAAGVLVGPPKVHKVMPYFSGTYSNPVSDIAAGAARFFLCAERTMAGDYGQLQSGTWAHQSRLPFYVLGNGSNTGVSFRHRIGDAYSGDNSAGGIGLEFLPVTPPMWSFPVNVWGTGDALHVGTDDWIYGLQRIRQTGNQFDTTFTTLSKLVDLDYDIAIIDKSQPGDVEVVAKTASLVNCPDTSGGGRIGALCFGDGTGTACPCANNGDAGRGCKSSMRGAPFGALLTAVNAVGGPNPSVSVTVNDLGLKCENMIANTVCMIFQGTASINAGLGQLTPLYDGLGCVGGAVVRLGQISTMGGTNTFNGVAGVAGLSASGQTLYYQASYRNVAAFCTPAVLNTSNAVRVDWTP
jgi:hypothetical protein